MTSSLALEEVLVDADLRYINFFNGRLLSAEDLKSEQDVHRARARHLGQALGTGVAYGLEVSPDSGSPPSNALVRVTKGLAINRVGQTLRLECDQIVALVRSEDGTLSAECVFSDCAPLSAGTTFSNSGYYLLTIAPASKREGRAPVSGLGNRLADCNSRYFAEGVQFRLLPLSVSAGASPNLARNIVAYQCFGLPARGPGDFVSAALNGSATAAYGFETLVPAGRLTQQDVPLAVVQWLGTGGLGLIDLWPVRRRVTRPSAVEPWSYFAADRRRSEGEAMFLQFENHIRDLLNSLTNPATAALTEYFAFLPPVGVLPVHGTGSPGGFDPGTFFGAHASMDVAMLDAVQSRALLEDSFLREPVPLSAVGRLQLYLIWESVRAVEAGTASQLILAFASPALPYRGTARFGYAKWSLSRFADSVI